MRDHLEESVTTRAGKKAFAQAQCTPDDIDIAELHDSTAHCELKHIHALGLDHDISKNLREGKYHRTGTLPINASGGLISKGHPLGATGVGQIFELCTQLRQEGGKKQVLHPPKIALAHNAGGMIGFDEALCVVSILERVVS